MATFYFETETTGVNPLTDKIISIQVQQLSTRTAEPIGPLIILKEWESSEKQILQEFIKESGLLTDDPFSFIPVGYNLGFEHNFLRERCIVHQLPPVDILNKPTIDIRSLAIIANGGVLKGSGLEILTGKHRDSKLVPEWYAKKQYAQIEAHVKNEAQSFIQYIQWLYASLPAALATYPGKRT